MKITIDFWGEDNDSFAGMSDEDRAAAVLCQASYAADALEENRVGNRAKLPLRDDNGNSVAYLLVEYEDS